MLKMVNASAIRSTTIWLRRRPTRPMTCKSLRPAQILVALLLFIWLTPLAFAGHPVATFSIAEVNPWGKEGPDGQAAGLLADLATRLGNIAGIKIRNNLRPYPRTIQEVASGLTDFAVMFAGPSSEEIAIPVGTVTHMQIILVTRSDYSRLLILDDLKDKNVGYIRGSLYGKGFENNSLIKKVPLLNMPQGLRMLMAKRLDGMVSTDQALYHTLRDENLAPMLIKPALVIGSARAELYFSRASTNRHLIEPIRKALMQMKSTGELQELFALPGKPAVHFYDGPDQ